MAHFPAALSDAPFAQVPEARCESGGGTLPISGAPRRARELSLVER